jgi:catechol 2,3-dioxygenase-like lactoylglutathione lyase family enzyme
LIDHISIQSDDLPAATGWYDEFFEPLGVVRVMEFGDAVGYGPRDGFPSFWLGRATDRGGRQVHIAFTAADRDAVQAVFAVVRRLGTEVLHEPRVWPEYHPGYFAVFVRDPDGNNVEVVSHRPVD